MVSRAAARLRGGDARRPMGTGKTLLEVDDEHAAVAAIADESRVVRDVEGGRVEHAISARADDGRARELTVFFQLHRDERASGCTEILHELRILRVARFHA